ncbi:hypothetical protein GW916_01370 [bacterium]|nr:hypothetical protein [bacterium]
MKKILLIALATSLYSASTFARTCQDHEGGQIYEVPDDQFCGRHGGQRYNVFSEVGQVMIFNEDFDLSYDSRSDSFNALVRAGGIITGPGILAGMSYLLSAPAFALEALTGINASGSGSCHFRTTEEAEKISKGSHYKIYDMNIPPLKNNIRTYEYSLTNIDSSSNSPKEIDVTCFSANTEVSYASNFRITVGQTVSIKYLKK